MRPSCEQRFCFGVLVLAAGRSARMGRPKLLLPWGATTVLGHLLSQWRGLGSAQTVVVLPPNRPELGAELDRLGTPVTERVVNPAPELGMFSSLQCGAGWAGWRADLTHYVVALGDQPHLRRSTLEAVLALAEANPEKVCQPARGGRAGHPVVMPSETFRRLTGTNAGTLKAFLAGCLGRDCEVEDPGLHLDLDSPEDYQRALVVAGMGVSQGGQARA